MKNVVFVIGLWLFAASTHGDAVLLNTDRGTFYAPLSPQATVNYKVLATLASGERYQIRVLNQGALLTPRVEGEPFENERNYHTFDLSGLTGTITGATLRVWADVGAYDSSASSETVGLFDVSTSASVLSDPDSDLAAAVTVFDDLGTGNAYGSFVVSVANDNSFIDATLNTLAVADLNAAIGVGSWSVGGALLTIDGTYNAALFSERVLKSGGSTPSEPRAELLLIGALTSNGDIDSDGVADNIDNCPGVANAGQANNDGAEGGDACDNDDDNDGVEDNVDNCRIIANVDQADANADGCGDACIMPGCAGPVCSNL